MIELRMCRELSCSEFVPFNLQAAMTFCCGYAAKPGLSPGSDTTVQRSREQLKRDLASVADSERARSSAWFFKTGKGEYAEGDRFLGIPVPLQRRIALQYR